MEPRGAVHLLDPKREDAAERTRDCRRGEEEGDAPGLLVARVPERDVVGHAREKPRFCQAEEKPGAVGGGGFRSRELEWGGTRRRGRTLRDL